MENWQLQQILSLPLEAKIIRSINRIRQWHEHYEGDVYVSFSGGKDSTVLAHLVRSIYPEVPLVFCNTGLEYPEIVEFVKKQENVVWLKPAMSFKQVIDKHGFPITTKEQAHYIKQYRRNPNAPNSIRILTGTNPETGKTSTFKLSKKWHHLLNAPFKISDECCKEMKKKPFFKYERQTKRKPFIGIVSGESILRNQYYMKNGCNAFDNQRPSSTPLAFWTEQDILQYIKQNDLEIASVYGEIVEIEEGKLATSGASRTGCMFCGFGVHLEPHPNRFQQMKITHPKLWEYCIFNLGMAEPLQSIHVDFGQQVTFDDVLKGNVEKSDRQEDK